MNCFYHSDRPAIAICRSCSRGLCRECGVDIGTGLACPQSCETRARKIDAIIDRNDSFMSSAKSTIRRNGQAGILFGLVFMIFGGYIVCNGPLPFGVFMLVMGLLYFIYGIFNMARSSRPPYNNR